MATANNVVRNIVLVADDEEKNRELLRKIFQNDYTVALTNNGKEAMEYIVENNKRVAILLLDMHMPVVDGRALLKAEMFRHI
jgi:putative two-component system response regulator